MSSLNRPARGGSHLGAGFANDHPCWHPHVLNSELGFSVLGGPRGPISYNDAATYPTNLIRTVKHDPSGTDPWWLRL